MFAAKSPVDEISAADIEWANRHNGKQLVLVGITVGLLVSSLLLVWPFLSALTWAVTVAVVTHRLWIWLQKRVAKRGVAAAVAVLAVALTVLLPIILLVYLAAAEIVATVQTWQKEPLSTQLSEKLAGYPRLNDFWQSVSGSIDVVAVVQQVGQRVQAIGTTIFSGIAYTVFQAALMLFVLFYLYRDEDQAIQSVRRYSPLTEQETSRLLIRVSDTIHATIYGSVVVAVVQGSLGCLIFWILGLPGAAVWGLAMGLLAMVPYLGTFVVWVPAAIILAVSGQWTQAAILVGWGVLVIGLIDNLLYPTLVGNRLRQHTVVSFVAIIGGLTMFGASGIVLGPVLVTTTFTLLELWRERSPRPAGTTG
jgi:predicted PurR-regulated permease PerM